LQRPEVEPRRNPTQQQRGTNLEVLRGKVEGGFDGVMDRASGW